VNEFAKMLQDRPGERGRSGDISVNPIVALTHEMAPSPNMNGRTRWTSKPDVNIGKSRKPGKKKVKPVLNGGKLASFRSATANWLRSVLRPQIGFVPFCDRKLASFRHRAILDARVESAAPRDPNSPFPDSFT
jgi:hypothetical protein